MNPKFASRGGRNVNLSTTKMGQCSYFHTIFEHVSKIAKFEITFVGQTKKKSGF